MRRAADRVLVHADPRSEEPRDEIDSGRGSGQAPLSGIERLRPGGCCQAPLTGMNRKGGMSVCTSRCTAKAPKVNSDYRPFPVVSAWPKRFECGQDGLSQMLISSHAMSERVAWGSDLLVGRPSHLYNGANRLGKGDLFGGEAWKRSRILSRRRLRSCGTRNPKQPGSAMSGSACRSPESADQVMAHASRPGS